MSFTKVCEWCSKEYEPSLGRHNQQKFCGNKCRNAAGHARLRHTYICVGCGEQYQTAFKDRDRYCSRACFYKHNKEQPKIEIKYINKCICGKLFTTTNSIKKYCSNDCLRNDRLTYDYNQAVICTVCGQGFVPNTITGRPPKYCSNLCYESSDVFKQARRRGKATRRARIKGARVEAVNHIKVFERDKWTCQLCGDSIDKYTTCPHPLSATIDHIVPLSLGGDHSMSNVQCAHFACNSKKGAGVWPSETSPPTVVPSEGLSRTLPQVTLKKLREYYVK